MKKTIIAAAIILSAGAAAAADDSAQLRQLQAENRALKAALAQSRKQIAELTERVAKLSATVQRLQAEVVKLKSANAELRAAAAAAGTKTAPPPAPTTGKASSTTSKLAIRVEAGGWGDAGVGDIRNLLLSAGKELLEHFPGRRLNPIIISHSNSGPIVLYRRGPAGEYIVKLDVEGRHWAQFSYQFAHELCHILANYGTKTGRMNTRNKWFEESLCETASLFVLRRMAVTWKTAPPYPNWKSYSAALQKYAADVLAKKDQRLPAGTTLAKWYRDNAQALRKAPCLRAKNRILARRLLPLLEASPESWAAVGYLNLDPPDKTQSFEAYLKNWHRRCPKEHKQFVRKIAHMFDLDNLPGL